jgi:hypothetical protein
LAANGTEVRSALADRAPGIWDLGAAERGEGVENASESVFRRGPRGDVLIWLKELRAALYQVYDGLAPLTQQCDAYGNTCNVR